ncbi:MAG: hypothetical protein VX278_19815 [Myxococcota bacterium]|nr:hypothetical protein [Myxococcota bacterium]
MIAAMLFFVGLKGANACDASFSATPESFQVAWVSPLNQTVWLPNDRIEVVPLFELRQWVHDSKADAKGLLHHLGMLSRKSKKKIKASDYKITIFDIRRENLCRPIENEEPGRLFSDIPVCLEKENKSKSWGHRHGYTGCGYAIDTKTSTRSVDVYRIRWADASSQGFCVFPMQRFLDGA